MYDRETVAAILVTGIILMLGVLGLLLAAAPATDPDWRTIHTCEEDEVQYVTPTGLACTPLDDLRGYNG